MRMGTFGGDSTPFCQNACPGLRVRDIGAVAAVASSGPGTDLHPTPPSL